MPMRIIKIIIVSNKNPERCCLPAGCGLWLVEGLSDSGSIGSDSAAVESGSGTTGTGPTKK